MNYSYLINNRLRNISVRSLLNEEETNEAYEYLLNTFKDLPTGVGYNSNLLFIDFDSSINVLKKFKKECSQNNKTADLISDLFNINFFSKFKYVDEIHKFYDTILAEYKIDDIKKTIEMIKKNNPLYMNFPLVIMNPNISIDDKISAVKSTYRQKDLPKYLKYFRSKLTDLNDLDAFIEATILQNNRVKEKDSNIVYLFKTIFIPGNGARIDYASFKNLDVFAKKYLPGYFLNPQFIEKLYANAVNLETCEYWRKDEYHKLIRNIFAYATFDQILEISKKTNKLICLNRNITDMFNNKIIERNGKHYVDELENRILSTIIGWIGKSFNSRDDYYNNSLVTLHNTLDKTAFNYIFNNPSEFPVLKEYYNKYTYLNDYSKDPNVVNPVSTSDEIFHAFSDFADISADVIREIKFGEDSILDCFGYNYEALLKRKNSNFEMWRTMESIKTSMENMLSDMHIIMMDNSADKAKVLIDKIYSRFENDETAERLSVNLMNLYSANEKYISVYGYSDTPSINDALEIIDKYIKYAAVLYKLAATVDQEYLNRYETLKANIDNVVETISLLCNIK